MKRLTVFTGAVSCLIFLCLSIAAQDFRAVAEGVEYAETTREVEHQPVRINLLRLDLTKVRLDVVHAMDAAIGLETTSSIASRHGALAAINAGFFRLDRSIFAGDAAGVLQIDGRLLSESVDNRIALGIINGEHKTEVEFGHVETKISLITGVDSSVPVSGINRERKANEVVLFTPEFGRSSLTDGSGSEFVVKTSPQNPFAGNVRRIYSDKGSSLISANDFVISASGEKQRGFSRFFKKSTTPVRWSARLNLQETGKHLFFSKAEDITNGVPQLIKNSRIEITWQQEKAGKSFAEARHPRTAVAKLKDGKFLMATIDGRSAESAGMNLNELAAFLLELNAADAINLDGGGSTTMFLNGKIVNKPSDKEGERRVGDAILVFPRRKNSR